MSEAPTFAEWIARVRAGDAGAAEQLVRRYEPDLRRVVRLQLRRNARLSRLFDSIDICQSILGSFFTRVACGAYDLSGPDDVIKLLAAMARNNLLTKTSQQQAQRRDCRRVETAGVDERELPGHAATPSRHVAAREILDKLRVLLSEEERYLADQRSHGRDWVSLGSELQQSP